MTHTITARVLRRGLPAAVALLVACAAPAPAAVQPEPTGDWLRVKVSRGDARAGAAREALLQCDPPRGHAEAARACADLDAAQGDLHRIPLRDTYCPMVYAPVTAEARGQWRGRSVEYKETFPNTCVMTARTGAVFALDTAG
ncbi:SSI family serine proteinase inhibitor [Streptomyces viridiviolaceus]